MLERHLTRVDRFNPALNDLIWQNRDAARRRANAADAARMRAMPTGLLHGLPMTVKESYNEICGNSCKP